MSVIGRARSIIAGTCGSSLASFLRNATLTPIVAMPVYIPTDSEHRCLFPHILPAYGDWIQKHFEFCLGLVPCLKSGNIKAITLFLQSKKLMQMGNTVEMA